MAPNQGVYFLANDRVLELTIAFLNSFRKFNPDIALCLIPYNSDINILSKLNKIYNFAIYSKNEILSECDNISINFHGQILGHYRKLAAWEGDFDKFIYIDIDTVVLTNIDFAFQFLSRFDFITSHSSIPAIRKFVWKDSIYSTDILDKYQINFSANTGFFVSHKSALPLTLIKEKLETGLKLLPHMELLCAEQPFLNYLFVTSGKYNSLYIQHYAENRKDIPLERWAGYPNLSLLLLKSCINVFSREKQILLVHWAGLWKSGRFDQWLVAFFKLFGIKKELPLIRFFMKQKILWKYFRYLNHEANNEIVKGKVDNYSV